MKPILETLESRMLLAGHGFHGFDPAARLLAKAEGVEDAAVQASVALVVADQAAIDVAKGEIRTDSADTREVLKTVREEGFDQLSGARQAVKDTVASGDEAAVTAARDALKALRQEIRADISAARQAVRDDTAEGRTALKDALTSLRDHLKQLRTDLENAGVITPKPETKPEPTSEPTAEPTVQPAAATSGSTGTNAATPVTLAVQKAADSVTPVIEEPAAPSSDPATDAETQAGKADCDPPAEPAPEPTPEPTANAVADPGQVAVEMPAAAEGTDATAPAVEAEHPRLRGDRVPPDLTLTPEDAQAAADKIREVAATFTTIDQAAVDTLVNDLIAAAADSTITAEERHALKDEAVAVIRSIDITQEDVSAIAEQIHEILGLPPRHPKPDITLTPEDAQAAADKIREVAATFTTIDQAAVETLANALVAAAADSTITPEERHALKDDAVAVIRSIDFSQEDVRAIAQEIRELLGPPPGARPHFGSPLRVGRGR